VIDELSLQSDKNLLQVNAPKQTLEQRAEFGSENEKTASFFVLAVSFRLQSKIYDFPERRTRGCKKNDCQLINLQRPTNYFPRLYFRGAVASARLFLDSYCQKIKNDEISASVKASL